MSRHIRRAALLAALLASAGAFAENPATLADNVRHLSMGDSFAAGKGAIPVTQGYAYLLYQGGTFGSITNMTFANAAVGGTTSADVLNYQVPQVIRFKPHVVTMMVGGNDLQRILRGEDPNTVVAQFIGNMDSILCGIKSTMQVQGIDVKIIVANQPDFPWLSAANPQVRQLIMYMNGLLAGVAQKCGASVADVFTAFDGRPELFLYYRAGASPNEPHPTNVGHRVIAKAFEDAAK